MPVFSNNTVPGPPSVSELARALKWNIDLIFQWVYLNVDYFPSWGDTKGGLGCLIDGVGNSFDQSTLLIQLLTQQNYDGTACAYTSSQFPGQSFYASATSPTLQAAYVIADTSQSSGIQLTGSNPNQMLSYWLGVTNNSSAPTNAEKLLNGGGVPNVYNSGTNTLQISHVWVQLTLTVGETNHVYVLDPSCKLQDASQEGYVVNPGLGISGLETAMSSGTKTYSVANLISDAGGTISSSPPTTITGLNRANVREDLTTYSRNLVDWIQTNNPGARLADIIGGKSLTSISSTPYKVSTGPSTAPVPNTTVIGTPVVSATIPNGTTPSGVPNYFNQIWLNFGLGSQNIQPIYYTSQVYGNRFTCYLSNAESNTWSAQMINSVTGEPIASINRSFTPSDPVEPSWSGSGSFSGFAAPQFTASFINLTNDSYADTPTMGTMLLSPGSNGQVPYTVFGFAIGPVSRNMVNFQQSVYTQNKVLGGSGGTTTEPVWGALLNLLWLTKVAEDSYVYDMTGSLTNCQSTMIITPGSVCWYYYPTDETGDYIIDIQYAWSELTALDGDPTGLNLGACGIVTDMHGNTGESLSIQQVIGNQAISSAIVIDQAILDGQVIYQANSDTDWNDHVWPALDTGSGGYTADVQDFVGELFETNTSVLIPYEPLTWTSNLYPSQVFGWSATTPFSAEYDIPDGLYVGIVGTEIAYLWGGLGSPDILGPAGIRPQKPGEKKSDPIHFQTGDYVYSSDDFSTGSQSFPYGLTFTRYYDSSKYLFDGQLGLGWRHNFSDSITLASDAFQSQGLDVAAAGAITIVELLVCVQLIQSQNYAINYLAVNHIARRWWQDQCTNNIAIYSSGFEDLVFTRLPYLDSDTTYDYLPPPRYALSLAQNLNSMGVTLSYAVTDPQQTVKNFNAQGQWTSWTLPPASAPPVTVTLNYSGGVLSSVSNAMGRTLNFVYSGGYLSQVNDGTGRTVHYYYSGTSPYIQLITFQDPLSNLVSYSYAGTQLSLMTEYILPANLSTPYVQNTFDSLNRVKQQVDPNGNTYQCYFAGWRSEEDDPLGNGLVSYFNSYGSIVTDINKLGYVTSRSFDGLQRITSETYPESNSTAWTYPSSTAGGVIGVLGYNSVMSKTYTPKPGSGLTAITENWQYDSYWNKPSQYTNLNGNTTTFTYDDPSGGNTGRLLKIQRPAVGGVTPTITLAYNSRGQLTSYTDETSIVTVLNYSTSTEELLSVVRDYGTGRLNLTSTFGYDSGSPNIGNVVTFENANGNTTTLAYDAKRRLITKTDPTPFSYVTELTYDANDNRLTVQRQTNNNPAWQVFTWTYTPEGKIATFTDPLSYETVLTYDTLRRLETYTDAQEREWQYAWDAFNRLSQVTDPSGTVSQTRTYTQNGWLETLTQYPGTGNAATTTYVYDGFDRPLKKTFPDGSYEENQSIDNDGNILTFQNRAAQQITLVYDVLNRLIRRTLPSGEGDYIYGYDLAGRLNGTGSYPTVSYNISYDTAGRCTGDGSTSAQLDADGNVTKLTFPNGSYFTKAYDQLDRLISITLSGSSSPNATFGYDALSRRNLLTFSSTEYVAYAYQLNNDVTNILHVLPGGISDSVNIQYNYDKTHKVTGITVDNSSFLWQPSTAGTVSYGTANNLNQYPTVGGSSYSYNGNGDLTSDGTNSYSYDAANRLTQANTATLSYDPLDRLSVDPSGNDWSWFGWRPISIGSQPLNFIHGEKLDDLVFQVNVHTSTTTNVHLDRLGSPIQSGGYGPFGENGQSGPAGFTGQQYFSGPGIYHYRSRFYSPKIGRFMQPDSIGYRGGINLYTYVMNDPESGTDPFGMAYGVGAIPGNPLNGILSGIGQGLNDLAGGLLGTGIGEGAAIGLGIPLAGLSGAILEGLLFGPIYNNFNPPNYVPSFQDYVCPSTKGKKGSRKRKGADRKLRWLADELGIDYQELSKDLHKAKDGIDDNNDVENIDPNTGHITGAGGDNIGGVDTGGDDGGD